MSKPYLLPPGLSRGTAELSVGFFNAQDLANTAWAFATGSLSDAPLVALNFAMLARKAEWRNDDFNAQELSNTA